MPIAGCIGDDEDPDDVDPVEREDIDADIDDVEGLDDTGDDPAPTGDHVSQDFVLHMEVNPEEATFFGWYGGDSAVRDGGLEQTYLEERHIARNVANEMAFNANFHGDRSFYLAPTERYPQIREASIVEGEELQTERAERGFQYGIIPLRHEYEYPRWSDGTEMVARDVADAPMYRRFLPGHPWNALELGIEGTQLRHSWEEMIFPDGPEGKSVQFSDPWGALDIWSLNRMAYENSIRFSGYEEIGGHTPTHLEPLATAHENAREIIEHLIENPAEAEGRDSTWIRENAYTPPEGELTGDDLYNWREPEHVVTTGAWQLAEIRGTEEIVLEPNPEWVGPEPNFERVRCIYAEAEERQVAELMAGRLDVYPHNLPAEVFDQVPDKYEVYPVDIAATGDGVGMNHGDEHLGNRNVRAAMNRALDKDLLAEIAHAELGSAINVIGWDNPFSNLPPGIDETWAGENLVDYTHDPDAADARMQDEGYARNGEAIWEFDGEPLEYELATAASDTEFELAVADLWSSWGLDVEVRGTDSAAFEEQYEQGNFDMWPSGRLTGDFRTLGLDAWRSTTGSMNHIRAYQMFTDDEIQQITDALPEGQNSLGPFHGEASFMTVDVPEIGQEDGDPAIEIAPGDEAYDTHYNVPEEELAAESDHWHRFYWFSNWYLADIPCYFVGNQTWLNTENWDWSRAENHPEMWEFLSGIFAPRGRSGWHVQEMLGGNWIDADSDNPK